MQPYGARRHAFWVEKISDPQELRRCIRNLVALSTLPAHWTGYGPTEIADSVAAALVSMLEASFVYITLPTNGEEPNVVAHIGAQSSLGVAETIGRAITQDWFRDVGQVAVVPNPLGRGTARVVTAPFGFGSEAIIVAGSLHPHFPSESQRLLLSIAANDAAIALQRWQAEADQRRFLSLVEGSSDFVAFSDLDGRQKFVNSAGRDLVGLSDSQDISLLHVLDFIVPADRSRLREDCWPTALRDGRWTGELHFRHFRTGAFIPFLVDAFRIDNPRNGRPMNVATVSRDLTRQKQAEFDLRRLNEALVRGVERRTIELAETNRRLIAEMQERERADARSLTLQSELSHAGRLSAAGQMAAALAHELSQPLASVTNSANAARRLLDRTGSEKIDSVRQIMAEITAQSLRAGQILRRLRDFVQHGESEKRVESFRTMIEEASGFARVGFDASGVRMRFEFDSDGDSVLVNRIQIQQVLVNLMRNALEAMAGWQRAELDVMTHRLSGQSVEIVVADTGPGLASEVASRVFEPFVTTKRDGMGLGLSICRSIVEAHGGTLRYEPGPGGGAIFRFILEIATPLERDYV